MLWQETTIVLALDRSIVTRFPDGAALRACRASSKAWRVHPSLPRIRFTMGRYAAHNPYFPSNGVYLLDPWPHGAEIVARSHVSVSKTGSIVAADVIINGTVPISAEMTPSPGSYDLQTIMTHELGHILGLDENGKDRGSSMFPRLRAGDACKRVPSPEDHRALCAQYQAASKV